MSTAARSRCEGGPNAGPDDVAGFSRALVGGMAMAGAGIDRCRSCAAEHPHEHADARIDERVEHVDRRG